MREIYLKRKKEQKSKVRTTPTSFHCFNQILKKTIKNTFSLY